MTHPRFASFTTRQGQGYGLIVGDGAIDLSARFGDRYPTLKEVVQADAFNELLEAAGICGLIFSTATSPMKFPSLRPRRSSASA